MVVDDGRIAVAVGDVPRGVDSCPKRWQSVVIGWRRGHSDRRDGGGAVGGCGAEELEVGGQSAERFRSVADKSEPVTVDVKEVGHRRIFATMFGGRSPGRGLQDSIRMLRNCRWSCGVELSESESQ